MYPPVPSHDCNGSMRLRDLFSTNPILLGRRPLHAVDESQAHQLGVTTFALPSGSLRGALSPSKCAKCCYIITLLLNYILLCYHIIKYSYYIIVIYIIYNVISILLNLWYVLFYNTLIS